MLRQVISNDFYTILLLLSCVSLAVTNRVYPKRFKNFFSILYHYIYFKKYAKEANLFDSFNVVLFGNFILNSSIFSYLILGYFFPDYTITFLPYTILFSCCYIAFLILKVLFQNTIASVFSIEKITINFVFLKLSYKNLIGILLLPINAILLYSTYTSVINYTYLFLSFIVLLLIINFFGFINFIKLNRSKIIPYIFYFILYICTLEITPYVILFKLFKINS